MFDDDFRKRLTELRTQRNVSARDMSLSLGQNPSYINRIELGKAMPSMSIFLFICDYLKITPAEFFDLETTNPSLLKQTHAELRRLDSESLKLLLTLAQKLNKN